MTNLIMTLINTFDDFAAKRLQLHWAQDIHFTGINLVSKLNGWIKEMCEMIIEKNI